MKMDLNGQKISLLSTNHVKSTEEYNLAGKLNNIMKGDLPLMKRKVLTNVFCQL